MRFLYFAHVPFVLLFLVFTVGLFLWSRLGRTNP
jgi:hypothetical protein